MNGQDAFFTPDPGTEQIEPEPFVAAKIGAELDGDTLEPWSPPRKIAAQGMGMLYPLIGESGMEQLQTTGSYAGALKDTIIFLWLCTHLRVEDRVESSTENAARVSRAIRKPVEALDHAMRWAGEQGIVDIGTSAFMRGYKLFSDKMAAEQAARSQPDLPDGKETHSPKA